MKNNIKAVFFDVDGTLVARDNKITTNALCSLKLLREKGIKVFISTGRPKIHLDKVTNNMDFIFDGYILFNGAYCFVDNKVVRNEKLNSKHLDEAILFLTENRIYTTISTLENTYSNFVDPNATYKIFYPELYNGQCADQVYQLNSYISVNQPELEKKFLSIVPECKTLRWRPQGVDVTNRENSKGEGIKAIINYLGIKKEETMAFGDGENDIDMMNCVGISVAMGNATEKLKDKVDYITGDVESDGIMEALKYFKVL